MIIDAEESTGESQDLAEGDEHRRMDLSFRWRAESGYQQRTTDGAEHCRANELNAGFTSCRFLCHFVRIRIASYFVREDNFANKHGKGHNSDQE